MFLLTVIGPFVWALDKSFGLPKGLLFQFTHPYGGFTLWDIIMPLFIFMSGAAVPFAMKGRLDDGQARWRYWRHVLSRFALLWFLGMVVQGRLLTLDADVISPFNNTLQTIAFGYLACAIVYRLPSRAVRFMIPVALALLYTLILASSGDYSKMGNAAIRFERWFVALLVPQSSRVMEIADPGYTWWATIPMFGVMTLCGMAYFTGVVCKTTEWRLLWQNRKGTIMRSLVLKKGQMMPQLKKHIVLLPKNITRI